MLLSLVFLPLLHGSACLSSPRTRVLVADSSPILHYQSKTDKNLMVTLRCTAQPACLPLDKSPRSRQTVLPHYQSQTDQNLMLQSLVFFLCCTARPTCPPLDKSPGSGQRVLLHYQSKPSKNLMLLSLGFLPLLQASACLASPGQES